LINISGFIGIIFSMIIAFLLLVSHIIDIYIIDLLRKPYRDARPARVGGFPDHGRT